MEVAILIIGIIIFLGIIRLGSNQLRITNNQIAIDKKLDIIYGRIKNKQNMELTGKCKEEFKKWLNVNYKDCGVVRYSKDVNWSVFDLFYKLPKSMRYGLLEDYFDSVGIKIFIEPSVNSEWYIYLLPSNCVGSYEIDYNRFTSRPKARDLAVKKGDELRNEVLNKQIWLIVWKKRNIYLI